MYKLKCRNCGFFFDGYADLFEHENTCPNCNSHIFEEVEYCDLCGKYEVVKTHELCCKKCESEIKEEFQKMLNENFTKEEIKILNEIYDGEELK